ncbi:unnamed protein product [[Candida] boidinii]|uniref:Unnamed protein product n=1 Tax=Candida boidinii TaxID=5477 RepID=A0A9W6SWD6_CANBO|nr:unnamed protein product [[Candida] boidinii]GMF97796.1 unnamed protein product [[Candida] boidinii]
MIKKEMEIRYPDIRVGIINMADHMASQENPIDQGNPSRFDFNKIIEEIERLEEENYGVIIVYGLYALYYKEMRELSSMKIFIDCDSDVRLGRWIKRDVLPIDNLVALDTVSQQKQRSAKLEKLLKLYLEYSRVEMNNYIFPTKLYADLILPRGPESPSISLIADGIQSLIGSVQETIELDDANFTKNNNGSSSRSNSNGRSLSNSGRSFSNSLIQENNFFNKKVSDKIKINNSGPSMESLKEDNLKGKRRFFDMN